MIQSLNDINLRLLHVYTMHAIAKMSVLLNVRFISPLKHEKLSIHQ